MEPVIEAHPEYENMAILERFTEPERVIMFKVPWVNDEGKTIVSEVTVYSSLAQSVLTKVV